MVSEIKRLYKNRRGLFVWTIFVLLICFGFKLFNFSATLDNDWALVLASQKEGGSLEFFFYSNGRYMAGLIEKLFGINGVFVPYFSTFLGVTFLGINLLIMCALIDKILNGNVSTVALAAFCAAYISYPFAAQGIAFDSTFCSSSAIRLLGTCAVYILSDCTKVKSRKFVLGAFLLSMTFVGFQSRVSLYLSMFFFVCLLYLLGNEETTFSKLVRFATPFVIAGIVGLITYFLVTKIGASVSGYTYGYTNSMIGWGNQSVEECLNDILKFIKEGFYWNAPYGAVYNFIGLVVFSISVLYVAFAHKKKYITRILLILVFVLFFFIGCFSMSIALGTDMPYRSYYGLPVFVGAAWFMAIYCFGKIKYVRVIAIALFAFVFVKQAAMMNQYAYSIYKSGVDTERITHQLAHDIEYANDGVFPSQPVIFIGRHESSSILMPTFDAVGAQDFSWHEDERLYVPFQLYGYPINDSLIYDKAAKEEAQAISETMHCWPAEDSIYISDEFVIVKLSGMVVEKENQSMDEFLACYNSNPASSNMWIDLFDQTETNLHVYGWSYFTELDSASSSMQLAIVRDGLQYIYDVEIAKRTDIDKTFNPRNDGRYNNAGINIKVSLKNLDEGEYDVMLIMKNGKYSKCIEIGTVSLSK